MKGRSAGSVFTRTKRKGWNTCFWIFCIYVYIWLYITISNYNIFKWHINYIYIYIHIISSWSLLHFIISMVIHDDPMMVTKRNPPRNWAARPGRTLALGPGHQSGAFTFLQQETSHHRGFFKSKHVAKTIYLKRKKPDFSDFWFWRSKVSPCGLCTKLGKAAATCHNSKHRESKPKQQSRRNGMNWDVWRLLARDVVPENYLKSSQTASQRSL